MTFITRIFTALCVVFSVTSADAKNQFAPVVVVNERAVTGYELQQRMKFVRALGAKGDIRKVALDGLINERIQLLEARKMGIGATGDQIQLGMEEFAARGGLTVEQFSTLLGQNGIAVETFRDFIASGLLWREVVRAKFVGLVQISDREVERAIANGGATPGVKVLLSEIRLPADANNAKRSLTLADQISAMTSPRDFAQAVRKYSNAPSKGTGGKLNWIPLKALPPAVQSAVRNLKENEVSRPIRNGESIALYQLRAKEMTRKGSPSNQSLEYAQLFLPENAKITKIRQSVDTCDDLYGVAKDMAPEALQRDTKPLGSIPADISRELAGLDDGETSIALTRNGGATRVLLMLCGRVSLADQEASRAEVLDQLRNERITSYAAGYMAELLSEATIIYP